MPDAHTPESQHARACAVSIVERLRDHGHTAYLAGGCVRDELLGNEPSDYDVATDATPARVAELFTHTREVGRAFGVMHVPIERVVTEVATFRTEGSYTDRRRPDDVRFTTAEEDAKRRDFTINALFIDPLETSEREGGRVIDFVGGLDDLRAKTIRAVGDADERLAEDDLRSLRAVRFAARLGFEIEAGTREAIAAHAGELIGISRERIGDEARAMLAHPSRSRAAALMHELGLDAAVLLLPHIEDPPLSVLDACPEEADAVVSLGAWCVDRSLALRGGEREGLAEHVFKRASETVRTIRRALVLSNEEAGRLRDTLEGVHTLVNEWGGMRVAMRKRVASSGWFGDSCVIASALWPDSIEAVRADVSSLASDGVGLSPEPVVNGDDLVADGFRPGPNFKRWLDEAYNLQLEGEVGSREQAMARIREWAGQNTNK